VGSVLGASTKVDGTGVVLKPPYSTIPDSKPHVFVVQPNGQNPEKFSTQPLTSLQVGTDCTLQRPNGIKRVYVSLRDGTLKVWIREIPGSSRPELCARVSNVQFETRRLAVSASTSGQAYGVQALYNINIRTEGGRHYTKEYQDAVRMNDNNIRTGTGKTEHETKIDTKFFDLQAAFMLSLGRPDANEIFFKEVREGMETLFKFLSSKENFMNAVHSAFQSVQGRDNIGDKLKQIEQDTTKLDSDFEYLYKEVMKLLESTEKLTKKIKEQTKGIKDQARRGGSPGIFWAFVVASQAALAALVYYTRESMLP